MSYVRPARIDEVLEWLLYNFAEEGSEYVNVQAEELAIRLVEKYDLVGYFGTAQ